MRRAEEAGQQPRRLSPVAARTRDDAPVSADAAWCPPVCDDEVAELEREILDVDLAVPGDPRERALVDNAARRLADRALVDELATTGFTGPLFDMTLNELAAYAIATLMAWMRTGEIIRQCMARGRPLSGSSLAVGQWSRDDRLEIAIETTARALKFFINEALKAGKWNHHRGTTLKTYFVGSCLLQFPNVFDIWAREQKRWGLVEVAEPGTEQAAEATQRDACWSDPTVETVLRRQAVHAVLANIEDPQTRKAIELVMLGYSYADAGAAVGLSAFAVEGRLYRLRRRPR